MLEVGGDRQSLRIGAALLIAGAVVYAVVTPLFHPGGGPDPITEFVMYADSRSWTLVHAVQFASSVAIAFGLLALAYGLRAEVGIPGLVKRFAAASAVAGIALNGALYAVDGVALKEAVDAWVSSPPQTQPAMFVAVEGLRGLEWGLRSYVAFTSGLTLILLAIPVVRAAPLFRFIGYLMGLTGLAYVAVGVGYGASGTALTDHSLVGNVNYYLLVLVVIWATWLLVVAMRPEKRAGHPADGPPLVPR